MIRIGIIGCSGRVNQVVIEELKKRLDCKLIGALVRLDKPQERQSFTLYENIIELASNSDAIIDFSNPKTSLEIASKLVNSSVLLVSGTTGFTEDEFEQFKSYSNIFPIIWSANMSIGINLLHILLKTTVAKLGSDYDSAIIDIHHRHKKDSPSGTALALAQTIKDTNPQISSLRLGEEFGQHEVIFSGAHESMSLSHKTYNRNSYALGAISACIWGYQKEPGFYSMQDVLK